MYLHCSGWFPFHRSASRRVVLDRDLRLAHHGVTCQPPF
nr:MAG TPA: hypothetical protein [Caudoviricetes sp.]